MHDLGMKYLIRHTKGVGFKDSRCARASESSSNPTCGASSSASSSASSGFKYSSSSALSLPASISACATSAATCNSKASNAASPRARISSRPFCASGWTGIPIRVDFRSLCFRLFLLYEKSHSNSSLSTPEALALYYGVPFASIITWWHIIGQS